MQSLYTLKNICFVFLMGHMSFKMFNGCTFSSLIHQKLIEHIEFPQFSTLLVLFNFAHSHYDFSYSLLPLNQSILKPLGNQKGIPYICLKSSRFLLTKCHSIFPWVPGSSEITTLITFPFFKIWFLLTWKIQYGGRFIITKNLSEIIWNYTKAHHLLKLQWNN